MSNIDKDRQPPPDPLDVHIGERVRQLRLALGLSLQQESELLEVGHQQVSRYERGTQRLSAVQLYRLALTYEVPISHFFDGYKLDDTELQRLRNIVGQGRPKWDKVDPVTRDTHVMEVWQKLPEEIREPLIKLIEAIRRE